MLLWEVALRSQMGVALSFLEELWSRNLGHLFVSPIRPWEMVAALLSVSMLRMLIGVLPAVLLAFVLYAFNLFGLGPVVVLFFANLMVMGWWVALGVVSLILRHGAGAEAMAWSVLFGLTPFSAVFYPVSVLPAAMRPVAFVLPSSHVFEGMRAALGGTVLWGELGWAAAFNVFWLGVFALVFALQFRQARMRGALLNIGGMMETRFWLIRHALVAENERVRLYGIKDVPLCPQTLVAQVPMYRTLAAMLPAGAVWGCTPLQRTRQDGGGDLRGRVSGAGADGRRGADRAESRRVAGAGPPPGAGATDETAASVLAVGPGRNPAGRGEHGAVAGPRGRDDGRVGVGA